MRHLRAILLLPLVVFASGCVVLSLHPLGSKETTITDGRMLGTWIMFDPIWGDDPGEVTFSRVPNSIGRSVPYLIRFLDGNGRTMVYEADLVKLGDAYYLDMILEETANEKDPYSIATLHPHRFTRVTFKGDQVALQECDMKKLKALLKENPAAIAADEIDGKLILTAKTKELQAFLQKSGDLILEKPVFLKRKAGEAKIQKASP